MPPSQTTTGTNAQTLTTSETIPLKCPPTGHLPTTPRPAGWVEIGRAGYTKRQRQPVRPPMPHDTKRHTKNTRRQRELNPKNKGGKYRDVVLLQTQTMNAQQQWKLDPGNNHRKPGRREIKQRVQTGERRREEVLKQTPQGTYTQKTTPRRGTGTNRKAQSDKIDRSSPKEYDKYNHL